MVSPALLNRNFETLTSRFILRYRPVVSLPNWLFLVMIPIILGYTSAAFGLAGNSDGLFGLDGSLRTLLLTTDNEHDAPFIDANDPQTLTQTILRLTALGHPHPNLSYEVHWVQDVTASSQNFTSDFAVSAPFTVSRYRIFDVTWTLVDDSHILSTALFDRFNLKWSFDKADVTVGRQAISFGKAYFWNPLDIFFPFDSSQFDRDYKPGVDALRIDIPLGPFSGITVVGAVGCRQDPQTSQKMDPSFSDASWYGSALLGRIFTNICDWDVALQVGKIFGGYQIGAGAVGDLRSIQVRAEISQFWAYDSPTVPPPWEGDLVVDAVTGVIGFGHRFNNSLTLDLEYFWNGAADSSDLNVSFARYQYGSSLQISQYLLGLLATYEFTPLVFGQLVVIGSPPTDSAQIQPLLRISLSDEMDLIMGLNLNFGPAPQQNTFGLTKIQSEFGTFPNIAFLEWIAYF